MAHLRDAAAAPPAEPISAAAIEPFVRPLWRYLRALGATASEAEDLAQEAFVLAVQKGVLGAPAPALATFLRRSGRFLFLGLRRGGPRERAIADATDQLWERDQEADGGADLVAATRLCVDMLEGRARTAVELSYGFGDGRPRSRAEIAATLGMQESGVKTLLHRVRQKLRACIERRVER